MSEAQESQLRRGDGRHWRLHQARLRHPGAGGPLTSSVGMEAGRPTWIVSYCTCPALYVPLLPATHLTEGETEPVIHSGPCKVSSPSIQLGAGPWAVQQTGQAGPRSPPWFSSSQPLDSGPGCPLVETKPVGPGMRVHLPHAANEVLQPGIGLRPCRECPLLAGLFLLGR